MGERTINQGVKLTNVSQGKKITVLSVYSQPKFECWNC